MSKSNFMSLKMAQTGEEPKIGQGYSPFIAIHSRHLLHASDQFGPENRPILK